MIPQNNSSQPKRKLTLPNQIGEAMSRALDRANHETNIIYFDTQVAHRMDVKLFDQITLKLGVFDFGRPQFLLIQKGRQVSYHINQLDRFQLSNRSYALKKNKT